jgi:hypothetical protein
MTIWTTPGYARVAERLRNGILVLFALFVAHDAVYVARNGVGLGYRQAMAEGGHDAYWLPASLTVSIAAVLIFLVVLARAHRLQQNGRTLTGPALPRPSYAGELASTWLRLFPVVSALFAVQENIEHLAVDGQWIGAAPLVGPGSSAVLPVLAVTTFALAAVGSLLRWRICVLEARIAAAAVSAPYPRPSSIAPAPAWASVAASVAHRWILARRDAGRAPPAVLA